MIRCWFLYPAEEQVNRCNEAGISFDGTKAFEVEEPNRDKNIVVWIRLRAPTPDTGSTTLR